LYRWAFERLVCPPRGSFATANGGGGGGVTEEKGPGWGEEWRWALLKITDVLVLKMILSSSVFKYCPEISVSCYVLSLDNGFHFITDEEF